MDREIHEGKILQQFIKEKGYTMTQIAKRLDISRTTLYRRLKSKRLSCEFTITLANALHHELLPLILKGKISLEHPHQTTIIFESYIETIEKYLRLLEYSVKILCNVIINPKQWENSKTLLKILKKLQFRIKNCIKPGNPIF